MLAITNGNKKDEEYLEIPRARISSPALSSLIEEFILREGTDYGHTETSLEEKKRVVYKQLDSGRVKIVYSLTTQNTTLILSEDLARL
ncbi:MAG: YheU family protein [Bdellovibrionales bacterium]|nr:YheU family protein [Bdellovibrionales bacterium]